MSALSFKHEKSVRLMTNALGLENQSKKMEDLDSIVVTQH